MIKYTQVTIISEAVVNCNKYVCKICAFCIILLCLPSGELTIAKPLDHESRSSYMLSIQASDHGNPKQTTLTSIALQILDVNDNAPKFVNATYIGTITEGQYTNQPILTISATDNDAGLLKYNVLNLIGTEIWHIHVYCVYPLSFKPQWKPLSHYLCTPESGRLGCVIAIQKGVKSNAYPVSINQKVTKNLPVSFYSHTLGFNIRVIYYFYIVYQNSFIIITT